MRGSELALLIVIAVLAAIAVDVVLLRRWRSTRQKRGATQAHPADVYVFGAYSVTLSWLNGLRQRNKSLQPILETNIAEAVPAAGAPLPIPQEAGTPPPAAAAAETAAQAPAGPSAAETTIAPPAESSLTWRGILLEWSLIAIAVLLFCAGILDLSQPTRLPGNEAEVFQALDWTLVNSLKGSGSFPLWNPYLMTGLPFVADPMLHSYNPFITLPVLIFGVQVGFKVGVVLSFLLGAWGMWWLGRVLGMGRAARLWVALLFVFAGQPVARFFQGQYLFVLGFAWIPWVIAGLFRTAQTGRRRYLAVTVFSLGLLFFSGNAYYAFYMLFVIILFALVMLFSFSRHKPYISVDWRLLKSLAVIGGLALGLIAVQLLPLIEMWGFLSKSLELAGMQTVAQIILDYTSKNSFRPDAFDLLPAREEFYAYIGIIPFLALLTLPFAIWKGKRRPILFFLLVLLLVVVWIDLDLMPWSSLFLETRFLLQFRHLLRILIFGSFAIIVLAGLGIDALWKLLAAAVRRQPATRRGKLGYYAAYSGLLVLGLFMAAGVLDVYRTNRQYIRSQAVFTPAYEAMRWLRQHDLSDNYMRMNPNNVFQEAVISSGLRFIEVWYHFTDIRRLDSSEATRPVQARPRYIVAATNDAPPDTPGASLVHQTPDFNTYLLPDSLPYAFLAGRQALTPQEGKGELVRGDVTELSAFSPSPNRMEVIAEGKGGETLVVLTTHYPGWQVKVDGKAQELRKVGGYLAADVLPGVHQYIFEYRPMLFFLGLFISLVCLGITTVLLLSDLGPELRSAWSGLKSVPVRLRGYRGRMTGKLRVERGLAAVYRDGALHPAQPLRLEEGSQARVTVEAPGEALAAGVSWRRWLWATSDLIGSLVRSLSFETYLFIAGIGVYAFTRFYALESFPIYFFGDEAVQTLFAEDLLRRGFHGPDGTPFPIYVEAAGLRWTPLLSMYFHAFTLSLFGKSIFITRATSAAISLLGAASVALTLKEIFKVRFWWVGIFLVGLMPAWLLHSRTAFETVMTAAFYGCFLLFYLLYREKSPRYLYAAIIFAAMTFYTYSNAQLILAAAAVMLFISDFRYHMRHPAILLRGAILAGVLALPLILFRLNQPEAIGDHLRMVNTYWMQPLPLSQKVGLYLQKYAYGLSPQYWFLANEHDLPRHRMLGMAHIPTLLLPLVLLGAGICLYNFRSSRHRAILIAALATPVGAALVDVGIARVLAFIIPAGLLAGLGLSALLEWLIKITRQRIPYKLLSLGLFVLLSWSSVSQLRTALTEGPLWFDDYGLYGMQYGARQLFEEVIPAYLDDDPNTKVLVSSTWANGTDNFLRFFFTPEEQQRVRMDGVESYMFKMLPLSQDDLFLLTTSEYLKAATSPKFAQVQVEQVVPYPDGTPGFYLARLQYAPNVDEIFTAEQEQRRQLTEGQVMLDGEPVRVRYSQIDMGLPEQLFDGDDFTLMRGLEANPFILEFYFPEPRSLSELQVAFGSVNYDITARLYPTPDGEARVYQTQYRKGASDPLLQMQFENAPPLVSWLRLEIFNPEAGDSSNIHLRELKLLP